MSIIQNRDGGERQSAWDSERQFAERMYPVSLTLLEHQMILHLRMAGAGVLAVRVQKNGRGMRGLREFRVTEVIRPVVDGKIGEEEIG